MWPSCEDGGHLAQLRLINLAVPQGRDCHNEKVKSVGSSEKYECFIVNCIFNFFVGGGMFWTKTYMYIMSGIKT